MRRRRFEVSCTCVQKSSSYAFHFIPVWHLFLHIYLGVCQEQTLQFHLVRSSFSCSFFVGAHRYYERPFAVYHHTGSYISPCSSRFSRCPVIANRIALGPPLPVYCESAFSWKPKHSLLAGLAQRQAQLNEEEKMFEDV